MLRFFLSVFFLLPISFVSAENWKFRAREHFEIHSLKVNDQNFSFQGTHNTFNFWYEKPFNYSIGFAFGPLLGAATNQEDAASSFFGEKIHLLHLGIEGKYFPWKTEKLFGRLGFYGTELDKAGTDLRGVSFYGGFGWEFLYKNVGIALELGYRHSELAEGVRVGSLTPSIGIHFYNFNIF